MRRILWAKSDSISPQLLVDIFSQVCRGEMSLPICPNLKDLALELQFNANDLSNTRLISIFLHPGVQSLAIYGFLSSSPVDTRVRYTLDRVAQDIARLSPNLKSLTLSTRRNPVSSDTVRLFQQKFSEIFGIINTNALEHLYLSPGFLTGAIVEQLSHAPLLADLSICCSTNDTWGFQEYSDVYTALELYVQPTFQGHCYQALTSITLCMELGMVTNVLWDNHFPAHQLNNLTVRATSGNVGNNAIRTFLHAFSTRCPQVRTLYLALDIEGNDPSTEEMITAQTLLPLRSAVQLETLLIRDDRPLTLVSKAELLHLLAPLTRLRTAWIIPDPTWPDRSHPPLMRLHIHDIPDFLEGHPELTSLGLYMSVSPIDAPAPNPIRQLEELYFGNSPCPRSLRKAMVLGHHARGHSRVAVGAYPWKQFGIQWIQSQGGLAEDFDQWLWTQWHSARYSDVEKGRARAPRIIGRE